MDALLEKVFNGGGGDFRGYKKTTLRRRLSKRLSALDIPTYLEYARYLDKDPLEYQRLSSTLTIKVSEFFREPEVFDVLGGALDASGWPGIRAWSCGCACGEEAYSFAILVSERFGKKAVGTKIFATDIDPEALDMARRGRYGADSLANLPPGLAGRYFVPEDGAFRVRHDIREMVKFGTLDIVRNPSLSGIDVLFCRNLFIYFSKNLQERVFEKLNFSLKPGGLLVLGKAEVIPAAFAGLYRPERNGVRVYRKISPLKG